MKKKLYLIASAMLILCITATMLTACRKEKKKDTAPLNSTESVTEIQGEVSETNPSFDMTADEATAGTTVVYTYNDNNGYTVYSYVEVTNATEKPEIAPATRNNQTTTASQTQSQTQTQAQAPTPTAAATSVATTVNIEDYPTVPETNNGIMFSRTQQAARGQIVTVSVIMGTPNGEYSIEFYENETKLSDANGLGTKKADANGTVEWSFIVDDDCELGHRKLVIKEKGTDKRAQTFITVNG